MKKVQLYNFFPTKSSERDFSSGRSSKIEHGGFVEVGEHSVNIPPKSLDINRKSEKKEIKNDELRLPYHETLKYIYEGLKKKMHYHISSEPLLIVSVWDETKRIPEPKENETYFHLGRMEGNRAKCFILRLRNLIIDRSIKEGDSFSLTCGAISFNFQFKLLPPPA